MRNTIPICLLFLGLLLMVPETVRASTETSYTISYVLGDGAKNSEKNPSEYDGSRTITLSDPTRKGYTFEGWYTTSKYEKKVTQIKQGSSGDLTLYAKWKANKYKVKYVKNHKSVTGTMSDSSHTFYQYGAYVNGENRIGDCAVASVAVQRTMKGNGKSASQNYEEVWKTNGNPDKLEKSGFQVYEVIANSNKSGVTDNLTKWDNYNNQGNLVKIIY